MREATAVLEMLVNELTECLTTQNLTIQDMKPIGMIMSQEETLMMEMHDQRRSKKKILVVTEERKDPTKYNVFFSKMYMPEYLKYFFADSGGLV